MTNKDAIKYTAITWLVVLTFAGSLVATCFFSYIMIPVWLIIFSSLLTYLMYRSYLDS